MTARHHRRGFTVFELVVVIALLLLLAAVLMPSIGAFRGDSRQRGAADTIRAELSVARARAMEEGVPYRVALSKDKSRIRRAPDTPEFATAGAFGQPDSAARVVDYAFEGVTAEVIAEQADASPMEAEGWVTVAVVQPDGTCRDDYATVVISEEGNGAMYVRVRGITGASRVVPKGGTK